MFAALSSHLVRLASQGWHRALDLILPPLCLACDAPVARADTLCATCWKQVHFITPPYCQCCGAPFEVDLTGSDPSDSTAASHVLLCAACIATPPHFASARAAMLYDDASKGLALGFKHGDRTYLAKALGRWVHQAGSGFFADADYIMPVPLHKWRLFQRRYNQAALLARIVGRLARKPVLMHSLRRHRATPQQGHMNRRQRQDNIHGAFTVPLHHANRLKDKTVILIDDVFTTGATVNECARTLSKAGVKAVYVLTLARVKTTV